MKQLILFSCLFFSLFANAQETVTEMARYIGSQFQPTKNSSFICKEMRFASDNNNDTLTINVRLPLKVTVKFPNDTIGIDIFDMGIYYNCRLQQDTIYTILLKKICVKDIPNWEHSYYKINALFNNNNCSKFREKKKNTKYLYKGHYGKYVDIDNTLYEIVGIKPDGDCFYPH